MLPKSAMVATSASQYAVALWVARIAAALLVFTLSYANGAFSESTRDVVGVCAWIAIAVLAAIGVPTVLRFSLWSSLCAGSLGALAVFSLLSASWSGTAEASYDEFARVATYLGVLLLVTSVVRGRMVGAWTDGMAIGLIAVAGVALTSRFFPSVFPNAALLEFLPYTRSRLSFPVGYWNGLGILLALAVPLIMRGAISARNVLTRALWLAALPGVAVAIYLTSSRGAFASLFAGVLAFFALTPRRWAAGGAILIGAVGSGAGIAVMRAHPALSNAQEHARGGVAVALSLIALCLATGAAHAVATSFLRNVPTPRRAVGIAALVAVGLFVVVAVAASHPVTRFTEFKRPPAEITGDTDYVHAHLLSSNGSGRWQLWTAAVDAFRSSPLYGRGAGTFSQWWAQHASLDLFAIDAHSFYLQLLAELGIIGFLFGTVVFGAGIVAGARRAWFSEERPATLAAALTASVVVFAVGASVDWVWELSIVALVAIMAIALLVQSGNGPTRELVSPRVKRAAGIVLGCVMAAAISVPLLAGDDLTASRRSAIADNLISAQREALFAQALEPWASSPRLQLALIAEQNRDYATARREIQAALKRDRSNWQLWLVASRIATESGRIPEARVALAQVRRLNPRSGIFVK
jgi:O-antigen ligase